MGKRRRIRRPTRKWDKKGIVVDENFRTIGPHGVGGMWVFEDPELAPRKKRKPRPKARP